MKTKKFNSKLSLNKKTIANLNNHELNYVRGGDTAPSACKCDSEIAICQPTGACTATCGETDEWCTNQYTCAPRATCEGFTCKFPNTCNC